jgi:hypothetical protein
VSVACCSIDTVLRSFCDMQSRSAASSSAAGPRRRPRPCHQRLQAATPRHFLASCLVILMTVMHTASSRRCYVSHGPSRVANASSIDTCPEQLHGPNPSCGSSCATHRESGEHLCSFYCLPARHCTSLGVVRPDFEMSPSNFLEGCPREINYEPVESTELECSASCCSQDLCNSDGALRSLAPPSLTLTSGAASLVLFIISARRHAAQ